MKAIIFDDFGAADVLHLAEVDEPTLRDDDLLVRVHAAGVNRADLIQRTGGYKRDNFGDSPIMGLEIAGEVIAIGRNVHGHAVGERIMGIVGGGAYAELARIDHRMAMAIPDGMEYAEAAAIPEAFVTAHEAAFHLGRVESMDAILVHAGASGVGSAAIQLAHAAGARVFATASEQKLERVRGFGADVAIDYRSSDFAEVIARETDKRGVDVIVDFIGASYFDRNLASLNHGGRLVEVGLLGGTAKASLPLDQLLYRHLQVIGTVMKSRPAAVKQAMTRRFRERWLHRFGDGTLHPVLDSRYPLAEAAAAQAHMESGKSVGKIVLTM